MDTKLRQGFTLVELLVVIGILGILAGVLAVSMGGANEAANATKCLSNLRSLAMAANATAMESGQYPRAGSYVYKDVGLKRITYKERPAWISWYSQGSFPSTSLSHPETMPFYGLSDSEQTRYCITNGSIWKAVGQNQEVYRCPTQEKIRLDRGGKTVFSYAMNAKFGYDITKGNSTCGDTGYDYGTLDHAEKILLFAEIPVMLEDGKTPDEDPYMSDCALHFHASVNGTTYGKSWTGEPEEIGFNHPVGKKIGKGNPCAGTGGSMAHVVFADGHTAKYKQRTKDSGLSAAELTALLCEGKEIAFDGASYSEMR